MNGDHVEMLMSKLVALEARVAELEQGIINHRDQRGDDRCWLDDEKLYALIRDGMNAQTALDPELMYRNCRRFIDTRAHPNDRFAWGDTPGGSLLPVLEQVEQELPALLMVDADWQSLNINDEQPNVERLWMPYGQGRLFLHCIHWCPSELALAHPHPWPSAVRICRGSYVTAHGFGPANGPVPALGAPRLQIADQRYEMVHPDIWHYVSPVDQLCYAVMVTGKPWGTSGHRKGHLLAPLPPVRRQALLDIFRGFFPRTK